MKNFKKLFLNSVVVVVCLDVLFSSSTHAQSIENIDAVAKQWCKEIYETNPFTTPEQRLRASFMKVVVPFLLRYDASLHEQISQKVHYRIQRAGCKIFFTLADKIDDHAGSVEHLDKKPKSTLTKTELKNFKQTKNFYYIENVDGTKSRVVLKNNSWTSFFADGTYSKYKLKWLKNNEFEIFYIDGTNLPRAEINIKGDSYRYLILEKRKDYFLLIEYVKGRDWYSQFRLMIDQNM